MGENRCNRGKPGCPWTHGSIEEVSELDALKAERDALRARVKELEWKLGAIVKAWDDGWDCSRTPGHKVVDDAISSAMDGMWDSVIRTKTTV